MQRSTKKCTSALLKCSINKSGGPWAVDYIHGGISSDPMTAVISVIRPPGTAVPDGLLFHRRCFLDSYISEAPRPIAAKLCHMIAIWLESPNKVGQLRGPPLKNFRGQKHAKFRSIFCNFRL